jgi:hemolysin activation/secretion protein
MTRRRRGPSTVTRTLALTMLCVATSSVFAQVNDLDRLRQREERERLEAENARELDEQRAREAEPVAPPPAQAPAMPGMAPGVEFRIDRIVLRGDDALAWTPRAKRKRAILAKHEGTMMGSDEMLALVRDLMNDYAAEGFATTTVTLVPQNIKTGTLTLDVNWGFADGWRFDGAPADTVREHAMVAMLPDVAGRPLNMDAVDQAVEILNNGMQGARVEIVPAQEAGRSWLNITMQPKFPIGGSIGADNSGPEGPEGDGRYKSNLSLDVRGFGAEVWGIGGSKRHFYDGSVDKEDSANLSLAVPFGFWNLELRHNRSRYEKEIKSIFGSYFSDGNSRDDSLKLSRTLVRSKEGKTTMSLRIAHRDSNNYIAGTRIEVNSRRYTDLTLGVARVDQLWGGSLFADLNLGKGSPWLGANYHELPRVDPTQAYYTKWSGNLSWSRGFGGRRFEYAARGAWQYSTHAMLGSSKMTIGDEYTVRGYSQGIAGDRGAYFSSTVTAQLGAGVSAFFGADAGAVKENERGAGHQFISGAALGLRARLKNASLALTSATPLGANRAQPSVLYANVNVRF